MIESEIYNFPPRFCIIDFLSMRKKIIQWHVKCELGMIQFFHEY